MPEQQSPLSKFIKGKAPETPIGERPEEHWRRQAEADLEIYKALPPEVQEHLRTLSPEAHHGIIMNMRSMMPDERTNYGHSIMRYPESEKVNK